MCLLCLCLLCDHVLRLIYVFVPFQVGLWAPNRQELNSDTSGDFDTCSLPGKVLKRVPLAVAVVSPQEHILQAL